MGTDIGAPTPRPFSGHTVSRRAVSRRAVLQAGAAALTLAACGVSTPEIPGSGGGSWSRPRPREVPADELASIDSLAGAPLIYEVDGQHSVFAVDGAFADQLDATLRRHVTAAGWSAPSAITTYGTWRSTPEDAEPNSWHQSGRAFDLARVHDAEGREVMSCRYDEWGELPADDPVRQARERSYWQMAASLHHDFAYVLTCLYDTAHHNHIHVDNGLSGEDTSVFRPRSWVQVHAVQAMCRHVWGMDVEITSEFDSATRDATREVLGRLGRRGDLGRGDNWQAFLAATASA